MPAPASHLARACFQPAAASGPAVPVAFGRPRPARFRGATDVFECIRRLPLELRRDIYGRTDTLTRWLHGELPLPLAERDFRLLLADVFRHNRTDIAESLVASVAANSDGADDDKDSGAPPRWTVSWELLLVHSDEMRRIALTIPRPAGVGPYTGMALDRFECVYGVADPAKTREASLPDDDDDTDDVMDEDDAEVADSDSDTDLANDSASDAASDAASNADTDEASDAGTDTNAAELADGNCLGDNDDECACEANPDEEVSGRQLLQGFSNAFCEQLHPDIAAALNNLLDTVVAKTSRAVSLDHSLASRILECAAGLGRVDVVQTMAVHVAQPSWHTFLFAGVQGHLPVIRFLCDAGRDRHLSLNGAIAGGHADIAAFVHARRPDLALSPAAVQFALGARRTAAVWWLLQNGPAAWRSHAAFASLQSGCAEHGHLDLLEFAVEHGIGEPLAASAVDAAAQWGSLATVQWLQKRAAAAPAAAGPASQAACTTAAMTNSAANGHHELFVWLWKTFPHLRPTAQQLTQAAANGHMSVVDYFVQHAGEQADSADCVDDGEDRATPFDPLLQAAVAGGHLALSKRILASGRATPSAAMLRDALNNGHVHCARWLSGVLRAAGLAGLGANSVAVGNLVNKACETDDARMLAFLVESCGVEVNDAAIQIAERFDSRKVIMLLGLRR
ncbi:hypothetical protein HK105_207315 [Polyrhizophydium stewartii]|uniref:Ankyrin repeat protein n=1 Tax=Polyrhizophydium stewartii TaxID=2732419 RepID=A0ABR4N103_9FUNG